MRIVEILFSLFDHVKILYQLFSLLNRQGLLLRINIKLLSAGLEEHLFLEGSLVEDLMVGQLFAPRDVAREFVQFRVFDIIKFVTAKVPLQLFVGVLATFLIDLWPERGS